MVSDIYPTVSVIIPTHNRSQLLKRAIGSVLNQTYSKLECIVVDDASTDETTEVVASFNDDRIRCFRHKINRHASAARNTGIRHSKGELIAFLDDDDEWMDGKLEQQVNLLQKSPQNIGLVYCWMSYMKSEEELYNNKPILKGYIFKDMIDKQAIGNSSTLLVRRKVIDQIGGFDETLPRGNDGDFIRRVSQKYEVDYVPEVLVRIYSGHGYDRISTNDMQGVVNAIRSQRVKLKKFREELDRYPYQASNIYTAIAFDCGVIMKWGECIFNYIKAISKFPYNLNIYRKILVSIRMFILDFIVR
jgi:glycosyltransferase involved in cell wall biosynthesis